MKNNWEVKTLGDLLQKTETINPTLNPEKEFNYIDVSSVSNKTFEIESVNVIKGKDAPSRARKLIKTGDIIFATVRPTLRRISIIPEKFNNQVCSTGYFVLRAKENISGSLLFYYLLTDSFNEKMEKLQKGASYPAVTDGEVRQQVIHYPALLTEQQRIVSILDEAFAAIGRARENAKKNLQNARELFDSYLQSVFANPGDGWEVKTLGDIGKPSMCKRILKHQTSPTGDIPFYKIGTFGKKPDAFISKEIYDEFRTKYSFPKKGDVLISASGTIGRRVRYDGEPAFFQDSNIVWIANDEKQVLNDYLYVFYEFCDWQPSKGATISRLYNSNLTSIKIVFPKTFREQKELLHKLDALSAETKKLENIYRQKIKDLDELKKSILQKAFNGELQ